MNTIKPVQYNKNGLIKSLNLNADAANDDWIRAARLREKAKSGDEKIAKQLLELEDTKLVQYTFDELNEITDGMLDDWLKHKIKKT